MANSITSEMAEPIQRLEQLGLGVPLARPRQ